MLKSNYWKLAVINFEILRLFGEKRNFIK